MKLKVRVNRYTKTVDAVVRNGIVSFLYKNKLDETSKLSVNIDGKWYKAKLQQKIDELDLVYLNIRDSLTKL